jgi:hypothetical protein
MYMYVVTCTLGCFFPIQKIQCVSVYHIVLVVWVQVCIQMGKCVCQQSVVGIMSFARFCANSCCVWVKRLVGSLMVSAVLSPRYCVSMFSLPLSVPLGLSFVLSDVSTVFPVTHCVLWFSSVCCSVCLCMCVCAYVPCPVST